MKYLQRIKDWLSGDYVALSDYIEITREAADLHEALTDLNEKNATLRRLIKKQELEGSNNAR